ncbi:MAG TPA: hypothetical protein VE669_01435 [Actinomycetota bacterium]|nr:hypothetical protein [Actinomycetota bacterium]
MPSGRGRVGPTRGLSIVAVCLVVAGARFECSLGRGVAGTEGPFRVRTVTVRPAELSLPPGGLAVLEGLAIDELGGRVETRFVWTAGDPTIVSVGPPRAVRTVVTARRPGATVVTATHVPSGAADTVRVTVIEEAPP